MCSFTKQHSNRCTITCFFLHNDMPTVAKQGKADTSSTTESVDCGKTVLSHALACPVFFHSVWKVKKFDF